MSVYSDPTIVATPINDKVNPGYYIALFAGVVAIGMAGYFYYQTGKITTKNNTLVSETTAINAKIDKLQPVSKELLYFDGLAQDLQVVFGAQKDWTSVLATLQTRLYSNMNVESIKFDEDNSLSISGSTTDYTSYARVYSSFTGIANSQFFTKPKLQSMSRTETKDPSGKTTISDVRFSFKLNLMDNILKSVDLNKRITILNSVLEDRKLNAQIQTDTAKREKIALQISGIQAEIAQLQIQIDQKDMNLLTIKKQGYATELQSLTDKTDMASLSRVSKINTVLMPDIDNQIKVLADKIQKETANTTNNSSN